MTTYTWPDTATVTQMLPKSMEVQPINNTLAMSSPLNGDVTTFGLPGNRWRVTTTFRRQTYADRAIVESWLFKLSGQEHRMKIWDFARPVPLGTINQTGVTASILAAQFAVTMTLAGCGNTTTLKRGDWLEVTTAVGQQLLMNTEDATANASGVMVINFTPRLRGQVAAASAVILQKPSALYILEDPNPLSPRDPQGSASEFGVSWVEVFR
jgi:hypothetical protein